MSDDEWAFAAPYLTLMTPDAPQRRHDLREVFNAVRWIVRAGAPWRLLPTNFPPWPIVHQQTQRWIKAGCFETMAHDLRATWQWTEGRAASPTGAMFDSVTRKVSFASTLVSPLSVTVNVLLVWPAGIDSPTSDFAT